MGMDLGAQKSSSTSTDQGGIDQAAKSGETPLGSLKAPQQWRSVRALSADHLREGLSACDLGVVALDVLRGTVDEFIERGVTQGQRSVVGFMATPQEPVEVGELLESLQQANKALDSVYRLLVEDGPFAYKQRLAIVEINKAIRECVLDISSRMSDGVLGNGDLRSVMRGCINLSASLGQVIEGLEVLSVARSA
jgi:hypothetical protein